MPEGSLVVGEPEERSLDGVAVPVLPLAGTCELRVAVSDASGDKEDEDEDEEVIGSVGLLLLLLLLLLLPFLSPPLVFFLSLRFFFFSVLASLMPGRPMETESLWLAPVSSKAVLPWLSWSVM